MKPQNLEEKLIWYYLLGTYVWYFIGAQFVLAPALGWFLTIYLCKKLWDQAESRSVKEKIVIPVTVWVWIVSMLVIHLATIVGYLNHDQGIPRLAIATYVWVKGFALLALFPLIGACLNVRPQLLSRAVSIVCIQSLIFIPLFWLASGVQVPGLPVYIPPLKVFGGGEGYYAVAFKEVTWTDDEFRMQLFAPWCPALGMVANIFFFIVLRECDKRWRWAGIVGAITMVIVSKSRLALIALPITLLLVWLLTNFTRPAVQIAVGSVSFLGGLSASWLFNLFQSFQEGFSSARSGSSLLRQKLGEIALYRWQKYAPIWGHGPPEFPGPKVTEEMPIGSHHHWYALLFLKGIVGCIAGAVPLVWSFFDLLLKAQRSELGKTGLSILLVIIFFTFGETLDSLAYLFWPGLLFMGIAFRNVEFAKLSEFFSTPSVAERWSTKTTGG